MDCRYHCPSLSPVEPGTGEEMGEREHGGTIVSPNSPRQPLRSFCKSEQPLELLQNPSIVQEAFEHPTTRRCRSVPHCPHKLITLAGLHVELNSWRTVPPLSPLACPLPCTWLHRLAVLLPFLRLSQGSGGPGCSAHALNKQK